MYTIKYRTAANAKYIGLLAHCYSHRKCNKSVIYTYLLGGGGISILIKWPSKLAFFALMIGNGVAFISVGCEGSQCD